MCAIPFREGDGRRLLPYERFVRLVDELPELEELHLQGLGEPLLHPRFFDMVAYAAARGVAVSTNSNLTLLTPRLAERCVTSGLRTLHVSVDGARPDTYEAIRRDARFAQVARNVGRLIDAKRRHGSPLLVSITTVAMRLNLDEIPAIVELAARWGVDEVNVQHLAHDFDESTLPERYRAMHAFVAEQSLLGEDPARIERRFAQARAAARRFGLPLRLPRLQPAPERATLRGRERCGWTWERAYVAYDGSAMPCCMVGTPDRAQLGNVFSEGVAAVWNGAAYAGFRAALASEEAPEICRSCAIYRGTF